MQKAHLYEATLLVNRGIDDTIGGLKRLNRAQDSGLAVSYIDEMLMLFEMHRTLINRFFCNNIETPEQGDELRFARLDRTYQKNMLHEVQIYRDVQAVEEARRLEGGATKVSFLASDDQQAWERQYPKPPIDAADKGRYRYGVTK